VFDLESLLKKEKSILTLCVVLVGLVSISIMLDTFLNMGTITKHKAMEISRNTPIVQEALSYGGEEASRVTANHWNATYIALLRQEHPNFREIENLPEDYGVWRIFWNIMPEYHILHFIDETTGQILFEGVYYVG
jgi:hypothetical protein